MSHPALTSLRALTFFDTLPELDSELRDWLLLEDSMTKRFEQFCRKVHVDIIREGFIGPELPDDERACLPQESRYWLREIVLCGDGEPWLIGRTVVPESTLCSTWAKLRWAAIFLPSRRSRATILRWGAAKIYGGAVLACGYPVNRYY